MSIDNFLKSKLYKLKSPNLLKLGFNFNSKTPEHEYSKIQSLLYTEYHIKCESMLTIMKQFNIPSSKTMDTLFTLFDIESRSFSEATLNAIIHNRNNFHDQVYNFLTTYHTSWFGEIFYIRSSYELKLAKILDNKKIKYYIESLRIKYYDNKLKKYRVAIPDFYLPYSNTIIEVKSTYWLDQLNMEDKKQCYINLGYNFLLYLDLNDDILNELVGYQGTDPYSPS